MHEPGGITPEHLLAFAPLPTTGGWQLPGIGVVVLVVVAVSVCVVTVMVKLLVTVVKLLVVVVLTQDGPVPKKPTSDE